MKSLAGETCAASPDLLGWFCAFENADVPNSYPPTQIDPLNIAQDRGHTGATSANAGTRVLTCTFQQALWGERTRRIVTLAPQIQSNPIGRANIWIAADKEVTSGTSPTVPGYLAHPGISFFILVLDAWSPSRGVELHSQ